MGIGGGVFTNDDELAKKVRMYRDWGRQADVSQKTNDRWPELPSDYNPRFIYEKIGYNFQILDLQAAMGRVQLRKIKKIKEARKKNFDYLVENLPHTNTDLIVADSIKGADVCWFSFPLTYTGDRSKLLKYLEKNGIETRPMFSGRIDLHPAYANSKFRISGKLKEANYIIKHSFWISCHNHLSKADLKYIVKTFDNFFNGKN